MIAEIRHSILICFLVSCQAKEKSFKTALERASMTNDSIRFSDTVMIRSSGEHMIRIFSKGKYIGYADSEDSIDSFRKPITYPLKIDDANAEKDYGQMIFSQQCIICHDVSEVLEAKFDEVKRVNKPQEILLNSNTYLYIPKTNIHWYISRYSEEQERCLKRYLKDY